MLFVITGPESTGKSTLAAALARHLNAPLVDEVARDYLSQCSGPYLPADLLAIANRQRTLEQATVATAKSDVVADTDLQTIYIWWQERYGAAPRVLTQAYADLSPRQYLLCAPDLAWQPDPLRENPFDRERLFDVYHTDLERRGATYTVIRGQGEARTRQAIDWIGG